MLKFLVMTNDQWAGEAQVCLADELDEVMKGWDDQILEAARIKAAERQLDGDEVTTEDVVEEMKAELRSSWYEPTDEDLADLIRTGRYTGSEAAEAEVKRLSSFCNVAVEGEPVSQREAAFWVVTAEADPLDASALEAVIEECEEWLNTNPHDPENVAFTDTQSTLASACEALVWLETDRRNTVLHLKDDDGDWFLRVLPE